MTTSNVSELHGIVPPMVTPLTEQMKLDQSATSKLLSHLMEGKIHGLFILGTTGEAPSLSNQVKLNIIQQLGSEVGTSLPWLVGISDTCLAHALDWARIAKEHGAAAVVAAPPFYFPASQLAIYQFYEQLANQSPLPLFLYDIPSHTHNRLARETIIALLKLPNIVGYKDSSLDIMHFHRLNQLRSESAAFPYFLGPEEFLLETTLLGASGGVNGGANVFPSLYVKLYEAVQQQKLETAQRLHQLVMQISQNLYQDGGTVTAGLKFALAEIGIGNGLVAPPQINLTEEEKGRMRVFLHNFAKNFPP
ncbi:dihydrodipicolinate synthase family protein [Tunicatimonas pelagia]|uniref:dihydrodipicolinate synthase family protein n=1 Tax=Tunicatimonas pelagia TaxID=931531 RepID=UPI002665DAFA|nr:dihydrodipicolinate synthase family protein [Tunicatimonas pelagia]WKN43177.1 dihydrodipicolinate synthase family protein [Tunicatimonas pelagia]